MFMLNSASQLKGDRLSWSIRERGKGIQDKLNLINLFTSFNE
jgi:hypothetical protein